MTSVNLSNTDCMLTDTWLKNELSLKPVLSLQIKKTHRDLWAILLMKGIEELLF